MTEKLSKAVSKSNNNFGGSKLNIFSDEVIECARLVGMPFLKETVRLLSHTLEVRWVMLCEIDQERPHIARTIAFWGDGRRQDNIEYDLNGTPCSNVASGEVCYFREHVQEQFPEDEMLSRFGVQSYVGVPLHSTDGKLLGLMAIFHDQKIDELLEPRLTLELFAGRAAAELERLATTSVAERLGRIVEDSASETFIFDAETLKFILVNRGARENLGYSIEELRHLTPVEIKPAFSQEAFMEMISPLKTGKVPLLTFETIHRRKDGRDYDVFVKLQLLRDQGRPVFYATIEDITERNATRRELQSVTNRLDTVLNNTAMAVFLMNEHQQCVYMNGAAEQLTGYSFEETEGRTLHDVIHHTYPDGRAFPLAECAIDHALPENNQMQGEEVFVHKDGSFYPVSYTASPIRDVSGKSLGTVIEAKNITDEIKARETLKNFNAELEARIEQALSEREEIEAQLRQAQKMEAVGQLTGGVAHDFNNLLQIIGGNLDLLKRDVAGNVRSEHRIQMASAGVQRGAKLAQQLLAFSRKQALAPKTCHLGQVTSGMGNMLHRALGERIDVEIIVSDQLWNSFVDEAQVESAILNLAINARDAMDGQGRLTIEVSNADVDEFYARRHPGLEPGQYVTLSVTDSGCGMSPEITNKIFEPFFTTKEVGKGTGLGLSMVYGFVKQSGGQVTVYSEEGHGTTFRMYLPRSIEEAEAPNENVSGAIIGGTENILVVEDDEDVRSTVTGLLKELGYRVLSAEDAAAGLAIIESGARIDLLFTDVVMPGKLQSREMADRAKLLLPDIAVLFTSGYTENSIVHAGRLDDGVSLLSKPYSRDALARRVRECIDRAKTDGQSNMTNCRAIGNARKSLRILLVEDEALIRLAALEMLGELGHETKGCSTGTEAITLLNASAFDVLITDLGLPDVPGHEIVAQAQARWPDMQIVIATGDAPERDERNSSKDGRTRFLSKPYALSDLEDILDPLNFASQ
jgi:PAS domain S-box-containing protein